MVVFSKSDILIFSPSTMPPPKKSSVIKKTPKSTHKNLPNIATQRVFYRMGGLRSVRTGERRSNRKKRTVVGVEVVEEEEEEANACRKCHSKDDNCSGGAFSV